MTEHEVFLAALDKEPAERAAYLDGACGGDTALRRRIEALLRSHAGARGFLDVPAVKQLAANALGQESAAADLSFLATSSEPGALGRLPADPKKVKALFLAAVEKATPQERAAFLDEACGADEELRRRIDELLRAHDEAGRLPGVVERDPPAATPADDAADLSFLTPSSEPGSLGRLDHYEVLEVVGKGGMGTVLRARDTKLERVVALKVLAAPLAACGTSRQRFAREARAAAAVRDDHVIDIHAVCDDPARPYLVMEYIDGCTLEALLRRGGPLEVKEVLRIGLQVARGLAAAHKHGLVHRDVKPANILLENGVQRVKLTDFGLARAADDASLTQSGFIAGTPLYMAPEQAAGEAIDARADLFSLGSVLYELCTGRPAFRAPTTMAVICRVCYEIPRPIREVNPDIPEALCRLIERLHAKKPADRPASTQEVAELLAGLLADLNQGRSRSARGTPAPQDPARQVRPTRHRWRGAAAALVLLAVGLGAGEATGLTDVRGTVIRLLSPEGTLVVEVDDPGVSVAVDGGDVVISGAGVREVRLKPGQYKVQASKDGQVVRQELVTIARNGWQVVRVSQEAAPATEAERREKSGAALPAPKLKKALPGHTKAIINVAYSPDGRLLASGDEAGEVRVWDMPGGNLRYALPRYGTGAHGLAFSPDGKFLLTAAAGGGGDINVWEAQTGKPDGALKGHTKGLCQLSFGPDGKTLVSAGSDCTVRVWDFAQRREVRVVPAPDGQWIRSVVLSADGKIAVGGGPDGKVFLLGSDGQLLKTFDTSAGPVFFSRDGRLLAGTTWLEGLVTVWDVHSGEKVGAWRAHEGHANGGAFSHDGHTLVTAGGDGVFFWDVATRRQLAEVHHEGVAYQLAFSPDGGTLATTGRDDRLVKVWDVSFLHALEAPQKSK
jgi:sugar lactone lactonase YvrE